MMKLFPFFLCCISLSAFSQLTINPVSQNNPSCNGVCDGSIQVSTSGTAATPTFQWENATGTTIGTNSNTITGLCAGTYTLTVTTPGSGSNTIIYSEDFEGAAAGWNLNIPVAAEGADPNFWVINDNESGVAPGGCGVAGNGNNSLHVTSVFFPAGGAAYDAGGLCGLLFCPETHRQAISPIINTAGFSSIHLGFDYIANGGNPSDFASVWGNDGSGWINLTPALNSGVCGTGQGLWQTYDFLLPASFNNTNCQFAIQWDNNDDGVGTDPSVAINDFRVFTTTPSPGETATQNFILIDPTSLTISNIVSTNPTCGNSDGSISFDGNGGTGTIQFSIDNGVSLQSGNSFTNLPAASYDLYIEDNNGCSVAQTLILSAANAPVIDLVTTTDSDCTTPTGTITITASGGTAPYTYSINNGVQQGPPLFSNLAAGNYTVEVFDFTGCQVNSLAIINSPTPIINSVTITDENCGLANGEITINATSPSGSSLEYSIDNGVSQQTNATFSALSGGTYPIVVIDAAGCQATQNATVLSSGGDQVLVDADFTTCSGTSIVLNAFGPNINLATIVWDNGVTNNTPFTATTTTTYSVTAEDNNGCISTEDVIVTVTPAPVFTLNPTTSSGCSPLNVNFIATSPLGSSISWEFSNGVSFSSGNNHNVTFTNPGCVDLAVSVTNNGCTAVQSFPSIACVSQGPEASFVFNPTTLSLENTTANFINTSTNATNYFWNFGNTGFSILENPTHDFPSEAGFYTTELIATDANGCTDTASVIIQVEDEIIYYIPNSFTPTGDEFNEIFTPIFTSGFDPANYKFMVFNRWGEILFETTDHKIGWDGTYAGKIVQDGIYVYLIEYKSSVTDAKFEVTGHFSLLK
ncbi:MAG: T9SS type B sorting domain-containing protein [Fluviicola sp.]|jgi:gliding motility-associated-like protein